MRRKPFFCSFELPVRTRDDRHRLLLSDTMYATTPLLTKVPRGVHYCCECTNYHGKNINGKVVKLHKFPNCKKEARIWRARVKLMMKDGFVLKQHSRLCSEHFVGKSGPVRPHATLPSIFPHKVFKTSSVSTEVSCDHDEDLFSGIPYVTEHQDTGEAPNTSTPMELGKVITDTDSQFPTNMNGVISMANQVANQLHLDHSYSTAAYDFSSPTCSDSDGVVMQTTGIHVMDSCVQTQNETRIFKSTGVNCELKYFSSTSTQTTIKTFDVGCSDSVQIPPFTFEDIEKDHIKVNFYTGIPSGQACRVLFEELSYDVNHLKAQVGLRRNIRYLDEFFIVLMRLRLGLLLEDLADRFQISVSTYSDIFTNWIHFLYINTSPLIYWPSRGQINNMMPSSFQRMFPRCRIIIDCTDLFTDTSHSLLSQSLSYSHYKSGMTWKGLIGITPNGILSFVSDLWLESVSDQQITNLTSVLDILEPGDTIMADKGLI